MGWIAAPLDTDDEAFWNDWADLARSSPAGHPLSDVRYVRLAVEAFGRPGGGIWGVRLSGPGGCQAAAVLRRRPGGRWLSLRSPVLPVATLLARGDVLRPGSLQRLFDSLPGAAWLLRVYDCDPAYNPAGLTDRAHHAVLLSDHQTVTIDTVGDFDEYWRARSRRLRSSVAGSLRKLEADAGYRLVCVREAGHMAEAVANHAKLEASGWKGRQGSAMSPGDRYGRFYRRVLETMAATGDARAYQLWHGQELYASQLCTLARGTVATMKTAYLDSAAAYSPGRLLDYLMLRDLFADSGVLRVEYCVNATRFDLQWATQTRLLTQIDLPRHAWVGSVLRQVRRWRQPVASAPSIAAAMTTISVP